MVGLLFGAAACGGYESVDTSRIDGPAPGRVEIVDQGDGTAKMWFAAASAANNAFWLDVTRTMPGPGCVDAIDGCIQLDANGVSQTYTVCTGDWTVNAARVYADGLSCAGLVIADCGTSSFSLAVGADVAVPLTCAGTTGSFHLDVDCVDGNC